MTLKEMRLYSEISIKTAAGTLGVTKNAICNYEAGTRRISLEQVLRLAELYDATEREVIEAQLNSITVGKPD